MIKQALSFLVGLMLTFTSSACNRGASSENITVDELKNNLGHKDIVVLDVRTPEELRGELGKLDGVVNIPVQELESRIAELQKYKEMSVYVICRSGNRSKHATGILKNNGFKAINVSGGMNAWRGTFGDKNK
jgi:rhodanese-related sulfurtransferase